MGFEEVDQRVVTRRSGHKKAESPERVIRRFFVLPFRTSGFPVRTLPGFDIVLVGAFVGVFTGAPYKN